jgi:hypothetical protein
VNEEIIYCAAMKLCQWRNHEDMEEEQITKQIFTKVVYESGARFQ